MQNAGEFPSPVMHDFPISSDAARYYKSGKSFLYRVLPFWLASLADRLIVLGGGRIVADAARGSAEYLKMLGRLRPD